MLWAQTGWRVACPELDRVDGEGPPQTKPHVGKFLFVTGKGGAMEVAAALGAVCHEALAERQSKARFPALMGPRATPRHLGGEAEAGPFVEIIVPRAPLGSAPAAAPALARSASAPQVRPPRTPSNSL